MARKTLIMGLAISALMTVALPASAKGEALVTKGTIVVTGSAMAPPIVLYFRGTCPIPAPCESASLTDGFEFVENAGLFASGSPSTTPPAAPLGPRYQVIYRFTVTSLLTPRIRTATVKQDLYPFGPGLSSFIRQQPWFYTPPGQRIAGYDLASGWTAAGPSVLDILIARGVPRVTPVSPVASIAAGSNAAPRANREVRTSILAGGLLVLVVLVIAAAFLKRPRRAPTG